MPTEGQELEYKYSICFDDQGHHLFGKYVICNSQRFPCQILHFSLSKYPLLFHSKTPDMLSPLLSTFEDAQLNSAFDELTD